MKPDRSNYEIWLIDWFDGKLDQSGTDQLMRFLDENPDLREEAGLISQVKLEPGSDEFSQKKKLFRNPSELTLSQIETLSVAALENDITDEQRTELEENFKTFPENKKVFNTIQKTRLTPDLKIKFTGKKDLVKGVFYTGTSRRFTPVWISAAAVAIILITMYFLYPSGKVKENESYISAKVYDTLKTRPLHTDAVNISTSVVTVENEEKKVTVKEKTASQPGNPVLIAMATDSEKLQVLVPRPEYEKIPPQAAINKPFLPENILSNTLIACTEIPVYQEPVDDGRSKLEKFIAKNFREKLLKEDIPVDSPLKSYEIAEAGIGGLNKLLGWEMTLVKNSDEEGEIQSVSFNSRLLKFNAPVKNEEPPVTF